MGRKVLRFAGEDQKLRKVKMHLLGITATERCINDRRIDERDQD